MSSKNPLNNASEIIERFGGIRPMAAKIDTPVTTVQGWKKRDVIPGTRRDQIMTAAADNNIDLSDLTNGVPIANQNDEKEVKVPAKTEKKLPRPASASKRNEPKIRTSVPVSPSAPQNTQSQNEPAASAKQTSSQDEIFAAIEANNRKTLARSTWIACALILLAGLAAFVLLSPALEENTQDMQQKSEEQRSLIEQQSQELKTLKEQMNERTSFIENMMPEGVQAELQQQMDGLQTQARNIQNTVDQLSERAGEISSEISSSVLGPDAGPLSQRLEMLEEKMASFSAAGNFGDVVERIGNLEGSLLGQEQLKESVAELQNMVGNIDRNQADGTLDENLAEAQSSENGGALSQTLEGVSGNDLKAAAMLIAFSQLRDSLNREAPFENDLALLERLVDEDNTELQGAIDRLAPHADGGVLTASGLSGTFKGLSSDILESSLKGEDISFKEKAKARFSSLLKIEKEGELVNGTETQMSVSKAQKLLDDGNIQGAIAELQTLEGDAALTAQPFIERAEVSLMAEKVQQMLGENILSRISNQIPGADMLQGEEGLERSFSDLVPELENPSNLNMDDVKRTLEEAVPNLGEPEVIRDEESGVTILPNQSGFKGFSGGQ